MSRVGTTLRVSRLSELNPRMAFADITFQNEVLEWRQPFEEFSKVIVGQTASELDQTTCQTKEC